MLSMEVSSSSLFDSKDIPICSVCDGVCLECTPLPQCSHPVCPKCLAMATLHTTRAETACRTCAEKKMQTTVPNSETSTESKDEAPNSDKREKCTLKSFLQVENNTAKSSEENEETFQDIQDEDKPNMEMVPCPGIDEEFVDKPGRPSLPPAAMMPGSMNLGLLEDCSTTLSDGVDRIREALSLATKYRHCSTCLQAKKSVAPDMTCMDCDTGFCNKCSARHKCAATNRNHIMVPVTRSKQKSAASLSRVPGLLCLTHKGAELGMYCRNCEVLVCRECIVDQHLDCPAIVSAQEYDHEEREAVQMNRSRYAQVASFFSDQRRQAEEAVTVLNLKKKQLQEEIRQFFSTLIKSCMDAEGSLLETLETSVTDHMDLLTEHSAAWLNLKECMQQLLDVSDVLHFLPTADFLPLSVANKTSLRETLRKAETLTAEAPSPLTATLSLRQALQQDVIKRIQKLGSKALTVSTTSTMILRKMTSTSFSAPNDKRDPQVTSMASLTQTSLVAADFNNSCLKLLHKVETADEWVLAEVLPLKWRPYALTVLSQQKSVKTNDFKVASRSSRSQEDSSTSNTTASIAEGGTMQNSSHPEDRPPSGQSTVCTNGEKADESDGTVLKGRVAVTSPSSGCFIVSVPLGASRKRQMEVVKAVSNDKGCWGITVMDGDTLAVATVGSGHCYINMIDVEKKVRWRLPLESKSASHLQSPRQILATSPSSLMVCDKGKKAVFQITVDGTVLSMYTGHGKSEIHPEGVCMDSQGYLYVTDTADNSVTLLTKGGTFHSRTSRQQNDLICPYAVCTDMSGCLYVANEGGKTLNVYAVQTG